MTGEFPTALLLIIGGLVLPFFKGIWQKIWALTIPIIAFVHLLQFTHGLHGEISFLNFTLVTMRVDKLSLLFGYI